MKYLLKRLLLFGAMLMILIPAAAAAGEATSEMVRFYDPQTDDCVQLLQTDGGQWDGGWTTYKEQLTDESLVVYEKLEDAFANDTAQLDTYSGELYWTIPGVITGDPSTGMSFSDWRNAMYDRSILAITAFVHDHPEYFWIRQNCMVTAGYDYQGGTYVYSMDVALTAMPKTDTREKRDALQVQLDTVIEHILSQAEGMTELEKLLFFDNWLARNNTYNSAAAADQNYIDGNETPWSIVGSLLRGYSPVCEGYAKAFQLLCKRSGIPCLQVDGVANGGGHMWTAVRYEGTWYFSDPTWDDPLYRDWDGSIYDEPVSTRNYFMTVMPDSHFVRMSLILPELSGQKLSYHLGSHKRLTDLAVASTCYTHGVSAGEFCAFCGKEFIAPQQLPLAPHTPETVPGSSPTCGMTGMTDGEKCSVCGTTLVEQEEIPAVDHLYTTYVSDDNATCTADGTETALCDYGCGTTDTRTVAGTMIPHSHTEYVYNEDATCVADGTETALCDYGCGTADTRTAVGSMIPHSHTVYVSDGNATCTADGTETALCDYGCGTADTRIAVGSMIAHSHTVYVSDGNATCTADGTETASCDYGCGAKDTRTEVGSMIAHSYTDYVSDGNATCMADGTETASCGYGCGTKDTRVIEGTKTDHLYTHYVYDRDNAVKTAACDFGCGSTDTVSISGDETWEWSAAGLTGEEYGSAEHVMIALYDAHGRMIAIGQCAEEYLDTVGGEMVHHFYAPVFELSDVTRAVRVVRFNVDAGYAPDGAIHTIFGE